MRKVHAFYDIEMFADLDGGRGWGVWGGGVTQQQHGSHAHAVRNRQITGRADSVNACLLKKPLIRDA